MVFWEKAKANFPLDCLYPVRLLFLDAICRKKDKGKPIVFESVAMGLCFCLKWDALSGERTISGTWILTKTTCSVSCHVVFLAIFCEWIRFGDSEISFWISSFDYRLLSKTLSYIWMSTELNKRNWWNTQKFSCIYFSWSYGVIWWQNNMEVWIVPFIVWSFKAAISAKKSQEIFRVVVVFHLQRLMKTW